MDTPTINQFTRRFVAGFYKGQIIPPMGREPRPTSFLQIRQADGSIAEVEVFGMNKKQAVEKAYKEHLQALAHAANMAEQTRKREIIFMTDPDNPMRHAGCGGKIAFEVSPIDSTTTQKGFCQSCGAAGTFLNYKKAGKSRFIVNDKDATTLRVFARGIVDSKTTFRMIRENILAMLKKAVKALAEEYPSERISADNTIMALEYKSSKRGDAELAGVPVYLLRDFCETLDPGEVLTVTVNEGNALLVNGSSKATIKLLREGAYEYTKKGQKQKTTIKLTAFIPDFENEIEHEKSDKWVALALPTGSRKKAFLDDGEHPSYLHHWGNFATDGIRIHSDSSLPLNPHKDADVFPPDFSGIVKAGKGSPLVAELDVKEFTTALRKYIKIDSGAMTIEFAASAGVMSFVASESALHIETPWKPASSKVKHHDKVQINPSYLLKALLGMGKTANMRVDSRTVTIESETRTAVISRMNF